MLFSRSLATDERITPMKQKPERAYTEDTIAAISTPPGEGAIAIVRLSGRQAIPIADKLFRGKHRLVDVSSHTLHHGRMIDPQTGQEADEVLVAVMRAPATYTAEDVVEINCHGGALLAGRLLQLSTRHGARLAAPGEFTRRAFLNGRIDLLQAEAVADVIRSKAEMSLKVAHNQLRGGLSARLEKIRHNLLESLAQVEAGLDFSDQDLPDDMTEGARRPLVAAGEEVSRLLQWAGFGRHLREGFSVVLVGRPNVGKSSLFNALLQMDRAIVTPVPGTTRDIISEEISLGGLPVKMVDTAGLHAVEGLVEKEGVRRTREQMATADLLIIVLDGSEAMRPEDESILRETHSSRSLVIINKIDLPSALGRGWPDEEVLSRRILRASAARGDGMAGVSEAIVKALHNGHGPDAAEPVVTALRHQEALCKAEDRIRKAMEGFSNGTGEELVAADLRAALQAVGEITGQTCDEEVLDRIFSRFCVGK
jgi:tRNA modification GTPase